MRTTLALAACLLLVVGCDDASPQRSVRATQAIATPPVHTPVDPKVTPPVVAHLKDVLHVQHELRYPVRLALGPRARIYVTDTEVGSIFIYDDKLALKGEMKGVGAPLGIAVDAGGTVYVGNAVRKGVDVLDTHGKRLRTIAQGQIAMPNDLALDKAGNLYVVDSAKNVVRVFDDRGHALMVLEGPGDGFLFPSSVAIAYHEATQGPAVGELYVADQGHGQIHVFDLSGNLLRSYGQRAEAFADEWQGTFARLQSLAVDAAGNVHAVDSYMDTIQVLDGTTGDFLGSYGASGTDLGQLSLPLDLVFSANGAAVVANAENHRVEVLEPTLDGPADGGAP